MSALRTISLRLRGTSVEILEEMGEETDGVVESTSKLQDKLKALTGVDILTDAGSYKDTYTILKEIGEVWQNLDPMDQAAALELMAGKNRANTLAAILNNMKDLKGAYESALGAEGSALKENAAHLDSIQGRIDLFNNSVQTMWMNFMNSDVLKFIINVGTGLVKLVNHIGLITTAIGGLFTWLSWSSKNSFDLASLLGIHKKDANFFKGFSIFGKQGLTGGIAKLFKSLSGVVDSNIKSMQTKRSIANTLTENIIGDSRDVEVTVQDFASAIRSNLESYVDIDTTAIDTQIDSVTNKLAAARKQLDDAKKADFNYYKTLGSKAPAKDRDARIQEASQSVKMLEAQLVDLEQKKNSILDSVSLATAETQKKVGEAQYQSMLSALNEIQGLKLSLGNEQYAAKQIDAISEAAKNGQTSLASYLSTLTDSDATLGNANMALRAYAASVQDGNYSLAGFQQFIQQHNAELQASSIYAKVAAVGHQALNAVLSMGVSLLASWAISAVIEGLDDFITTSEEVTDAAHEAAKAIDEISSGFKADNKAVSDIAERFAELAQGVDALTGKNLTLSTDDYAEFLDLSNQLADIFPTLSRNYDENGNAIVQLSGDTNTIVGSLKNLLDVQREIANQKIVDNIPDLYKGVKQESNSFNEDIDALKSRREAYQKELDLIKDIDGESFDTLIDGNILRVTGDDPEALHDMADQYVAVLEKIGLKTEELTPDVNENYQAVGLNYLIKDFNEMSDEELEEAKQKIKVGVNELAQTYVDEINNLNNQISSKEQQNKANWGSMLSSLSAWLSTESSYRILSDEMQTTVQTIINNMDFDSLDFASWEDLQTYIQTNVLSIFSDPDLSQTVANSISGMFDITGKLQSGDLSLQDYKNQMLTFVKKIKDSDLTEDVQKQILQMFDIDFENEDSIGQEIDRMLTYATKIVDDKAKEKVLQLSYSDLQLINSDQFKVEEGTLLSWDQLNNKVKEVKIAMTKDFTTDNFAEYAESIGAIQESIVTYKEALESLESGTFTFTDFMELIGQFPELADGVDVSSKEFRGLSDNLKRAIRNSPDDLVDDLKDLRAELIAADKSTDAIDQLIESIENMPSDAVDNLTNKYSTLADEINAAKVAQTELQKAMSENPNEGYETRGEAIEAMKTIMEEGKIGSESELWSIAKAFFGDNPKATEAIINQNAEALRNLIESRDQWYATDEDGNYTYEGIESFIEYVAKNQDVLDKFKAIWEYKDGQFKFDLDNEQWDAFAKALGLSSEEFSDLMVQIGQFFSINWGDADDALAYINRMTDGIEDPKKKLEQYGKLMEQYFGEDSEIDLTKRPIVDGKQMQNRGWTEVSEDDYATVYSSAYTNSDETIAITVTPILPDGKVLTPHQLEAYATEIANGADPAEYEFEVDGKTYTGEDIVLAKHEGQDAIEQANKYAEALHKAQEEYQKLLELAGEPLEINDQLTKDAATNKEKGLTEESVEAISEYASIIQDVDSGVSWVNFDELAKNAKEAGVDVTELGDHLRELQDAGKLVDLRITDDDPLGLSSFKGHVDTAVSYLNGLGVAASNIEGNLQIDLPSFVSMLQASGWTQDKVQTYIGSLLSSGDYTFSNGENVLTIETNADIVKGQVTDLYAEAENAPDEEIKVDLTGNAQTALDSIISSLAQIQDKEITVTTKKKTIFSFGFGGGGDDELNGTAHAHGTAYKSGSWGAPKTTEALVGELGPELRVRGNQWTLVGQDGAEFTDIRKGDIVFNHKQTQSLLENGYVTGRGKAYASGTAFASGGGAFTKYTFSDTDLTDASGKLSKAANDISKSADELSEDFKEVFDWIAVRIEEITEDIDLKSAKLENAVGSSKQNAIIDDMIALHQRLYDNLTAGATKYNAYASKLLAKIPAQYRQAAQDGSIAIESFTGEVGEETLNAIQDYREWVQKGADATQQAEETLTEIANLAKQAIDNIAQEYENKSSMPTIKIEQLEAYNSLIETTVGAESVKVYEAIIKENNKNIKILAEQRNKMQYELNAQVEAGNIKKYSQAWYDAINDIAAVDTEIIELTADTADYQDAINELHWDHFDNLISRLEAVSDESENLIDILGSKDLVDKDTAEWTDEGVTSLALYAQQMEVAEVQAKKYREEINYLNKNWKKLGYTEQEYVEKLEELKNGQYDAIKSYNDTKEAIKDLTSERVDAIKKGIEKEIEAYEELINKKKEELDAEKDLHGFQNEVADQQKEIADIERKLAALSADNSASARAQRAQLQAELAKAQQELQDTYYDRSVSDQQEALDKELENFREEKDKEMEGWDEYLENTEQVVSDSLTTIQSNTGIVYETLREMGKEYSLSIADAIVSPWEDGSAAIQDYSEQFKLSMSSTVEELQKLATEYKKVMAEIESDGQEAVTVVSGNASRYTNDSSSTASKPTTQSSNTSTSSTGRTYTVQNGDSLWSIAQSQLGNGSRWQEIYNLNKNQISNPNVISKGQKLKLPQYAKGTKGVLENQLAWIDELGEELVIRPQNGRLSFMEKGTGVIPADLTENLMEWGELDPSVMLERNRPEIKLHPEVHNTEVNITMDIAEVVHVNRVDNENMPDLTKAVEKQLDKYMKNLNNQIRRYVR